MKYQVNAKFAQCSSLLTVIESEFERSDCILQEGRNTIKKIQYNGTELVVKSFKKPNFINRIMYSFFRESKAKRSYQYSLKISKFVPEAIAFIECHQSGLIANSYFICEYFDYDLTIRAPLIDSSYPDREVIYKAFAKFTFELHQQGIYHRDYSPGNILIKRLNGSYQFKIIDLNRMDFKVLSFSDRMRNFAMLWASDLDLDLIVQEYARLAGLQQSKCQQLAQSYNHKNKRLKNFKKRLKGKPVND
ncbi:MAG: hypothetical protein OFPI_29160 [Osedax symbiont Rs2]|nr:MAG: hypothetical protein OFPI_29160 [Osedax symbiont Rs2]